ncbi:MULTISPECIES: hypothetical protein [unclassified Sphingomonas]|uniref:hypothetical protein n=1 Tax=unclassified Sphingomonas TaxID=196159 RepID=UPI000E100E4F|nr:MULTISPECIES: hypothetical protein [unclassified Sphingomonas]AXJ96333.1 hypothetical protein DM480_13355 [Sphingomonas sp. FARSPH]
MLARQDAVDVAVVELPAAKAVAVVVEIFRDRARAHGLADQANAGELHGQADYRCLVVADEQLLAFFASIDAYHARLIPERHYPTVPIA